MSDLSKADQFCPSPADHLLWNESAWFSFSIPEKLINGFIYYAFRPRMNLFIGGPAMWDPSGESSWNCLYYDWHHLQPMPKDAKKYDFQASNSLAVKVIEPLQKYRIRYDKNGFQVDLEWTAVDRPHELQMKGAISHAASFHIEQCGRMRGEIRQGGRTHHVDCYSMRDTSYGVRDMSVIPSGSYFWGIGGPGSSFHAIALGDGPQQQVVGGFLMRDGQMASLVRGVRTTLQAGRYGPSQVMFEAEDSLGRKIAAKADLLSDFMFCGYPGLATVWSLLRWNYEGTVVWGDNQEFCPPATFRQRVRSL